MKRTGKSPNVSRKHGKHRHVSKNTVTKARINKYYNLVKEEKPL